MDNEQAIFISNKNDHQTYENSINFTTIKRKLRLICVVWQKTI